MQKGPNVEHLERYLNMEMKAVSMQLCNLTQQLQSDLVIQEIILHLIMLSI